MRPVISRDAGLAPGFEINPAIAHQVGRPVIQNALGLLAVQQIGKCRTSGLQVLGE